MSRIAVTVIAAIAVVVAAAPSRSEDIKIERGVPDAVIAAGQQWALYDHTWSFEHGWGRVGVPKRGRDSVLSTQRSPLSETRSSQGSNARPQAVNAQGTPAQRTRYDAVKAAVGDWPVTEADILSGYDPQLIARSYARFGHGAAEEQDRQQWMADQEQRAIANDINRSKPLMYPVNGR